MYSELPSGYVPERKYTSERERKKERKKERKREREREGERERSESIALTRWPQNTTRFILLHSQKQYFICWAAVLPHHHQLDHHDFHVFSLLFPHHRYMDQPYCSVLVHSKRNASALSRWLCSGNRNLFFIYRVRGSLHHVYGRYSLANHAVFCPKQ